MPKRRRKNGHVPGYLLHKLSGQARVIINGKHIYLGEYGSPESREKYARLIAQLPSSSDPAEDISSTEASLELSVNEMLLKYYEFAKSYYVKNGEPTKELGCMAAALLPVKELYGHTRACDFGPKALKAVRQHLIDHDICRGVINNRVSRIKRVFKWPLRKN